MKAVDMDLILLIMSFLSSDLPWINHFQDLNEAHETLHSNDVAEQSAVQVPPGIDEGRLILAHDCK